MNIIDKRILNFLVIILLSTLSFAWTFFIFHLPFDIKIVLVVVVYRIIASLFIFKDYSLSWSKATQKTFLIKSVVYIIPFLLYAPYYYGEYRFAFMASELLLYIFSINFLMYSYYYVVNRNKVTKTKQVVIYGAGKAGLKLEEEFVNSEYKVRYFCDDDKIVQGRSIDSVRILSSSNLKKRLKNKKYDLLVIAMPSSPKKRVNEIYEEFYSYFKEIQILPALEDILRDKDFKTQLKDISSQEQVEVSVVRSVDNV